MPFEPEEKFKPAGRVRKPVNKLGYEYIPDEYRDPGTAMKKKAVQMLDPDNKFKPPGKVRNSINKLGYLYEPHCDGVKDPKEVMEKYKGVLPPTQILTNPAKKGGGGIYTTGVLFGQTEERKFPEHMPDDYDSAKKMRAKELAEHREKLGEQPPFKSMEYGNKLFHPNGDVLHYEVPTHIPREPKPSNLKPLEHESAFRPANPMKKGMLGALIDGNVPPWVPEPLPDPAKRRPPPPDDAPPPFRLNDPLKKSASTPSIVSMGRNMRAERPSAFRRPNLR